MDDESKSPTLKEIRPDGWDDWRFRNGLIYQEAQFGSYCWWPPWGDEYGRLKPDIRLSLEKYLAERSDK